MLVASRYRNRPRPLWHLPGGRQQHDELLATAAVRELREETGLIGEIDRLAYVAESFDRIGGAHVTATIFQVRAAGDPVVPGAGDHIADVAWIPRADLARRIDVRVVREPLLAHLDGDPRRYYGFADAGITIDLDDTNASRPRR